MIVIVKCDSWVLHTVGEEITSHFLQLESRFLHLLLQNSAHAENNNTRPWIAQNYYCYVIILSWPLTPELDQLVWSRVAVAFEAWPLTREATLARCRNVDLISQQWNTRESPCTCATNSKQKIKMLGEQSLLWTAQHPERSQDVTLVVDEDASVPRFVTHTPQGLLPLRCEDPPPPR